MTTLVQHRDYVKKIIFLLGKTLPEAAIEIHYSTPFELLIATILSAQCTDERVNRLTAQLFKKYRTPRDYLKVPPGELEEDIRPAGFFRNKTKGIRGCCQSLRERFNGEIPDTLDELVSLEGVGRKTANVVLGNAFGKPAIVVDTHVIRVSGRLKLSRHTDPVKIEFDLQKLLPQKEWSAFSHRLILHGRRVCKARKPLCLRCVLNAICPFFRHHT